MYVNTRFCVTFWPLDGKIIAWDKIDVFIASYHYCANEIMHGIKFTYVKLEFNVNYTDLISGVFLWRGQGQRQPKRIPTKCHAN